MTVCRNYFLEKGYPGGRLMKSGFACYPFFFFRRYIVIEDSAVSVELGE